MNTNKRMSKEAFQALPLWKKAVYLTGTYCWHTVLAALLIFLLGSWIWQDYLTPQPLLRVEMIDSNIESSDAGAFRAFVEGAGYHYDENSIALGKEMRFNIPRVRGEVRPNPGSMLLANVMSQRTDLYFWQSPGLAQQLSKKVLVDLREILPQETLERNADKLVYSENSLDAFPCGIRLDGNAWIEEHNYYDHCTVGVADTAADRALAADFLNYLLA